MKNIIKPGMFLLSLIVVFMLLSGCSALNDLLDNWLGMGSPDENGDDIKPPYVKPMVLCTYFHYFKAGPDSFDQWWLPGKFPTRILGPEKWRRDIWIGRTGDYPYIGMYNNRSEGEIMRWHIRLAKAAGISSFLVYINDWQSERPQTDLLLRIAEQEDFKIGFIEHHSFLGARSIPRFGGVPQPIMPFKYVGYDEMTEQHARNIGLPLPGSLSEYKHPKSRSLRNVPVDALNRARDRISGMLNQWKSHPAYLRINDKPVIVIPYMVAELTADEFKQLVDMLTSRVGELYVVAIVPPIYWYFAPEAVLGTGITKEWAQTGASSFTHWTPNGMITASPNVRDKVTQFHVKDSLKWNKDAMIPVMPGFNDDAWRPGNDPAPTSPRNNGQAWKAQLNSAFAARPRFIFIQGWNEWHEGSQIEPSTRYNEPYLYLKILAQKLNKPWQTPPLPPRNKVDHLRRAYLPY